MTAAASADLFAEPFWLKTTEYHTAGEPFRIVPFSSLPSGFLPSSSSSSSSAATSSSDTLAYSPAPAPCSVYAHRQAASHTAHPLNLLRQTLVTEPRGHADMYGGFILPPSLLAPSPAEAGAAPTRPDFGVLFWHKDGFSLACGHGTIALGAWAVDEGLIPPERIRPVPAERGGAEGEKEVEVDIEVPSGRVKAIVRLTPGGKAASVEFINVPSRVLAQRLAVPVPSLGRTIRADMSFGGAVYASVDVRELDLGPGGLAVEPRNAARFVALGREIKGYLGGGQARWEGHELYGTIFYEELGADEAKEGECLTQGEATIAVGLTGEADQVHQRNITVFADGAIDRSPCGSGTCARVALLCAEGKMRAGVKLRHGSVVGTYFDAHVRGQVEGEGEAGGVVVSVKGEAHLVGRCEWWIDKRDPVWPGFVFR